MKFYILLCGFIMFRPMLCSAQHKVDSVHVSFISSIGYATAMSLGKYLPGNNLIDTLYLQPETNNNAPSFDGIIPDAIPLQRLFEGYNYLSESVYDTIRVSDLDVERLKKFLDDKSDSEPYLYPCLNTDSLRDELLSTLIQLKGVEYEHLLTKCSALIRIFEMNVFCQNGEKISLIANYMEEGSPWLLESTAETKILNCEQAISVLNDLGFSLLSSFRIPKEVFFLRLCKFVWDKQRTEPLASLNCENKYSLLR